jgi:hypothetical protein
MRYECDNCGHIDTDKTLIREISRYTERVDEDGQEPDGECSKCGCLSYEVEQPRR